MHRGDIISKSGAAIDAAAGNEQRVVYREHNMPQLSRTTVAQHQIRLDSRIGFTSGPLVVKLHESRRARKRADGSGPEGISSSDPRILVAAAVVLTTTGLLAAWLPARRASRVAPTIAMQEGD